VLAILLFADRRPGSAQQDRYSHVVDLTDGPSTTPSHPRAPESSTRIIAPGTLIPGTWAAGQIPPERLVAPLVVMDLGTTTPDKLQISLDDIEAWEAHHGMIAQGSVIAIRRAGKLPVSPAPNPSIPSAPFPVARDAAEFLIEARCAIGFAIETPVDLTSDRTLGEQLALHGSYVVEGTARLTSLPATGSLVIVAPEKNKKPGPAPVRILAMVR
jgi:kynurenine formamidase